MDVLIAPQNCIDDLPVLSELEDLIYLEWGKFDVGNHDSIKHTRVFNAVQRDEKRRNQFKSDHKPEAVQRTGSLMKNKELHYRVRRPQKRGRKMQGKFEPTTVDRHYEPLRQKINRLRHEDVFRQCIGVLYGYSHILRSDPKFYGRATIKYRNLALDALGLLRSIKRSDSYIDNLVGAQWKEFLFPPSGYSSIGLTNNRNSYIHKVVDCADWKVNTNFYSQLNLENSIESLLSKFAMKAGLNLTAARITDVGSVDRTVNEKHREIMDLHMKQGEEQDDSTYWIKRVASRDFESLKNERELTRYSLDDSNGKSAGYVSFRYYSRLNVYFEHVFRIFEIRSEGVPKYIIDEFLARLNSESISTARNGVQANGRYRSSNRIPGIFNHNGAAGLRKVTTPESSVAGNSNPFANDYRFRKLIPDRKGVVNLKY